MADVLKRELKMLLQYLIVALLAGVVGFFVGLPSGGGRGYVVAINIHEAWLNYAPYFRYWLLGFAGLSCIRLGVVLLINKLFHG